MKQLPRDCVLDVGGPEGLVGAVIGAHQRGFRLIFGVADQLAGAVLAPALIAHLRTAFPAVHQTGEQIIGLAPVGTALFQLVLGLLPALQGDDGLVLARILLAVVHDAARQRFALQDQRHVAVCLEPQPVGDFLRRQLLLNVEAKDFPDLFCLLRNNDQLSQLFVVAVSVGDVPSAHPFPGGDSGLAAGFQLLDDQVPVVLRQGGKEHQQEFPLGVVLFDADVVFSHGDKVDVLPVPVYGAEFAVLFGYDVVLDELQRAQQGASEPVHPGDHHGVDPNTASALVVVADHGDNAL